MSGSTTKRGSAAAIAVFVAFVAAGTWVLLMAFVLGTEKKASLPAQLARHQSSRTLVWISENGDAPASLKAREQANAPIAANNDEPATLQWPTRSTRLSSTFGWRVNPITGENQLHRGVDIPVPCGTEVAAVEDGVVTFAEWTDSAGYIVSIAHDGGWVTRYAHLSKLHVRAGARVTAGALIAWSGDTGALSTGPHLHLEIWSGKSAVDPMGFRFRELNGVAGPSPMVACGAPKPNGAVAMGSMEAPKPSDIEAQYAAIIRRGH